MITSQFQLFNTQQSRLQSLKAVKLVRVVESVPNTKDSFTQYKTCKQIDPYNKNGRYFLRKRQTNHADNINSNICHSSSQLQSGKIFNNKIIAIGDCKAVVVNKKITQTSTNCQKHNNRYIGQYLIFRV